ncbi:protein translocase SEC61 complex gamma subunit, archaeal and eukaryotic [Fonsecaea erecta]|uniref:Protein translocase SEC61 complex gamma subunit, archaeal and eukaryotic n=1 Tax=Fonsecaea erecta TaxID=1367422 RepID=A0A178ZI98_9EURO|nr:protein translocase SEC61 complex gamma subunit, archaeal and eukaryotic [Fonsecaea erecta]OAP59176.1 protein translocase SEC61 complex gamma subunit, archaeal and eukaryotic [Fonsecaea erecta]
MSDILQEIADVPKEFFKDGTQFINRCTKRTFLSSVLLSRDSMTQEQEQEQQVHGGVVTHSKAERHFACPVSLLRRRSSQLRFIVHTAAAVLENLLSNRPPILTPFLVGTKTADRREFIKISQAVGMGFLIMGAIGYFIKLSAHSPTLSILRSFPIPITRREMRKTAAHTYQ